MAKKKNTKSTRKATKNVKLLSIDFPLDLSRIARRPLWNLYPVTPLLDPSIFTRTTCEVCMPGAVPQVQIIASKRVVRTGEPFNIKVLASSSIGLRSLWWFGIDTGLRNLDRAFWHELTGQSFHEKIWEDISIDVPGIYRLGANSRDVLYSVEHGVPHQASEGAGIAQCVVEVREDISYNAQVEVVKAKYGKSTSWRNWMRSDDIRARYEPVWNRCRSIPTTLKLAFRYGGDPLAYDPAWENEHAHMNKLEEMGSFQFPGLNFEFLFGANPANTDMLIEVGGIGGTSHAGGNYAYLYYETIFGHEFGHVLAVPHHYPGDDYLTNIFLPPGEEHCTMARNSNQYCSGCRAAMHLDLDADTSSELSIVTSDILGRYPY
ncbi:MAG: hypothetical protein DHS20C13_20130 [Thermodesulfobacteriota bacterium]|nr:MAG: hypothetical protein DHS20C13_20130 [Thermodesulfobacteriota bacterium]